MEKMKLKEFWLSTDGCSKVFILTKAAEKCQVSVDTVMAWMLGYRSPKGLNRDALLKLINDYFKVEIIEEGGK